MAAGLGTSPGPVLANLSTRKEPCGEIKSGDQHAPRVI